MRGLLVVATLALVACQASPPTTSTPTISPTTTVAASPSPTVSATPSPVVDDTPSLTSPPTDAPPTDARSLGWRTDFEQLVSIREDLHPEPWHSIPRDEYVDQVDAAIGRPAGRRQPRLDLGSPIVHAPIIHAPIVHTVGGTSASSLVWSTTRRT